MKEFMLLADKKKGEKIPTTASSSYELNYSDLVAQAAISDLFHLSL